MARSLGTPVDLKAALPDVTKSRPYEYDEAIRRRLQTINSTGQQQNIFAEQQASREQAAKYAALQKRLQATGDAQQAAMQAQLAATGAVSSNGKPGSWFNPFGAGNKPTYAYGKSHSLTKTHKGADFAMKIGGNLYAPYSGRVIEAGWNNTGYGNNVRIALDNGLYALLGHMSQFNVKPGDIVTPGQLLGLSGNSGYTTGPHAHFQLYTNPKDAAGSAINPNGYFGW